MIIFTFFSLLCDTDVHASGVQEARKLLPANSFIGVTVASGDQARIAIRDGADYLGIGTVFATPT